MRMKTVGMLAITMALIGFVQGSPVQNPSPPAPVGQVLVNVETTTMTVRPKDGQVPSPRGLWEAVERAGYQPARWTVLAEFISTSRNRNCRNGEGIARLR